MPRAKYWEHETPVEMKIGRNEVRWYKEAKQLQLYNTWEMNGEKMLSKGVTINVENLSNSEMAQYAEFFQAIFDSSAVRV